MVDVATDQLFSMAPTGISSTLVGTLGVSGISGFAVHADNSVYGVNPATGELLEIDFEVDASLADSTIP